MKVVHPYGMRAATLSGHIVYLEPGVVTELPAALATLALGHGASVVEHDEPAEVKAETIPVTHVDIPHTPAPVPAPETDHDKLVRIMKDMIERGSKDEFRADKQPKNAVLNRLFGKVVTEELRDAAWKEATTVVEAPAPEQPAA